MLLEKVSLTPEALPIDSYPHWKNKVSIGIVYSWHRLCKIYQSWSLVDLYVNIIVLIHVYKDGIPW